VLHQDVYQDESSVETCLSDVSKEDIPTNSLETLTMLARTKHWICLGDPARGGEIIQKQDNQNVVCQMQDQLRVSLGSNKILTNNKYIIYDYYRI